MINIYSIVFFDFLFWWFGSIRQHPNQSAKIEKF